MKRGFMNYMMAIGISGMSLALFGACSSDSDEVVEIIPNERVDIVLDGSTRAAAEELENFYVDFTTDAVRNVDSDSEAESKNVIVSPLSASMVLAMVANGVEENIREEIVNYIGVEDIDALNRLAATLLEKLPVADNQTDLKLANSIWVNNRYKLNNDYSTLMADNYNAQINYCDIEGNPKKVIKDINKWCSKETGQLIPGIIDYLDPYYLSVLLNAVYFKGIWKDKAFLTDNTSPKPFAGLKGTRNVDTMYSYSDDRRPYAVTDNFQAFEIPFGNTAFSLMVVLPNEGLSTEEANSLLTAEEMTRLKEEAVGCYLHIYMPKFKVDSRLILNNVFEYGIPGITGEIDFSMFEPVESGRIKFTQAATLEIDESGAKLSSVTSGELSTGAPCIDPNERYTVRVDRPFYFFLIESSTGACLLSGRIADL